MANLDLTITFNEDLLLQRYRELNIDDNAGIEYIDVGHPLDYSYRSPNQITTIRTEDNNERVLTYDSAQNYYQSERARILVGPERAEIVRLSNRPFEDGYVPQEDVVNHIHEWEEYQFDVAFKCNWLKFTQNNNLADQLLRTGNRRIVAREETQKGWADINAMILMIIRDDLQRALI